MNHPPPDPRRRHLTPAEIDAYRADRGLPPLGPGHAPARPGQPPRPGPPPPLARPRHPRPVAPAPASPAPPRTSRPRGRRRWIVRSLAALPVVLLLLVAVLGFWLDARINRIDALGRHTVGDTPGTVWLLVGSDSRAGLTPEQERELNTGGQLDSARTDTILLVYESPRNGTSLVSIPRDMWVDIPENGRGKINAAYAFGGPNLLVRTVEQNTGVHIDHYAEIGFAGLAGVVDALGTVRVCPPEPLKDPMAGIDLPAGCQELGGKDALGYARSRYASATGDLARVQRQRELIGAISDKAGSAGTLLNPFRSLSLAFSLADTLTIDKRDNLWHLLMLSRSLRDMETVTAPIGGFINVGGQSAIAWGAATRTFFEHMARGDKLPASSPPG